MAAGSFFKEVQGTVASVLLMLAVLLGASWGYPLIAEGADSPCEALAFRAIYLTARGDPIPRRGRALESMLGGSIVKAAIAANYPGIPPALVCGGIYWRSLFDANALRDVVPSHEAPPMTAAQLLHMYPQGYAAPRR
jgi:hypothetical protein